MKRILMLFICSFAIMTTGCEELAAVLESQAGCMLEDAPNFDDGALFPCTTDGAGEDCGGSNCCCEEIVYGCIDETKANYSAEANAACNDGADNDCCIDSVTGCMDQGANNYDPLATTSDETVCTYDDYGCMVTTACNYNKDATKDCDGVEGGSGDACCDTTTYTECYLDLNNNGYYEEMSTLTVATCSCATEGIGWVSKDEVADDMEVQGCTQATNNGQICPEYNPVANVDNGSCCLEEINWEDFAGFDSSAAPFLGVYNVSFTPGVPASDGTCGAMDDNTMEMLGGMPGGNMVAQITLGPPNVTGVGQMQYYEEQVDTMIGFPMWDYHPAGITTESECWMKADTLETGWFCGNWGNDNFMSCEDLGMSGECDQRPDCRWETNFCHPTFDGAPCETYKDMMGCEDNGCVWENDMCGYEVFQGWEECEFLSDWECQENPDCNLEEFGSDFTIGLRMLQVKHVGNSLLRGSGCEAGYIPDCSDPDDCLPAVWKGDGVCDDTPVENGGWGDLTCYNNDGGDCAEGESDSGMSCVPFFDESDLAQGEVNCFDLEESGCSNQEGCMWEEFFMPGDDWNSDMSGDDMGGDDMYGDDEYVMPSGICVPLPPEGPICSKQENQEQDTCDDLSGCYWVTDDPNAVYGPGQCYPIPCQESNTEMACDDRPECSWDMPEWADYWSGGACFKNDPCGVFFDQMSCANPMGPNGQQYNGPECLWNETEWRCEELSAPDFFCDCRLDHDKNSCGSMGGNWSAPEWCDDCEPECYMSFSPEECYYGYQDPCADFHGGNEETIFVDSDGDSATPGGDCIKIRSYAEGGTWSITPETATTGCLTLDWDEVEDPSCDSLNDDTCYCFDCELNYQTGQCAEWGDVDYGTMGRNVSQAIIDSFSDMIYKLSGSGNEEADCIDYMIMSGDIIHMVEFDDWDDDGQDDSCMNIMLTPATPVQ